MTLDQRIRNGKMTRRDFNNLLLKGVVALGVGGAVATNEKCSSSDPEPPPPPTKYKHSLKTIVERTLHFGMPITGGTYDVTMRSSGKLFPGISLGTLVNLDETTNRVEYCDVIANVPGCLPKEMRNLAVTDNNLTFKDVAYLGDYDHSYLLSEVLTHKVNGNSVNTSWAGRTMNGSANPDQLTGLRLEQAYIDYVKQALTEFINAGIRYKSTQPEIFIRDFTFDDNGNFIIDSANPPPAGQYRLFRKSDSEGVTNVTYPNDTLLTVISSIERVSREPTGGASPIDAYREAFDALIGDNQQIGDATKFLQCAPILAWRPRGNSPNNWFVNEFKESQEGADEYGTTITDFAQEYMVLERASNSFATGPTNDLTYRIGEGGIDYNVPIGKWFFAQGLPIRPREMMTR